MRFPGSSSGEPAIGHPAQNLDSLFRRCNKERIVMRVALVTQNRMRPPIAPIGVGLRRGALHPPECPWNCWICAGSRMHHGHSRPIPGPAGSSASSASRCANTDDCVPPARQSFLAEFAAIATHFRPTPEPHRGGWRWILRDAPEACAGPRQLGPSGVGRWRSFAPSRAGRRIEKNEDWRDLPKLGLAARRRYSAIRRPRWPLADLPAMSP